MRRISCLYKEGISAVSYLSISTSFSSLLFSRRLFRFLYLHCLFNKLNENNYQKWKQEVSGVLQQTRCWGIISSDIISPLAPLMTVVIDDAGKTEKRRTEKHMKKYHRFIVEFERYRDKQSRACRTILGSLEPTIRSKFEDDIYDMQPKILRQAIKKEYEARLKIDNRHGMLLPAQCKLENYSSVAEWTSAQKKLIDDLETCGISVDIPWRVFYIIENLPKSTEWTNFKQMLTMAGKAESTTELLTSPSLRSTAQAREGTVIGFSLIRHTSTEGGSINLIDTEVENHLFWVWDKRA